MIDERLSNIKFRGQRVDGKGWVHGYYHQVTKGAFVNPIQNASVITTYKALDNGEIILTGAFAVIPETVGQYIGKEDKNGAEIYRGSIVKSDIHNPKTFLIDFIDGAFCATHPKIKYYPIDIMHFYDSTGCCIEVIGDIHTNPELLEVQNESE